MQNVYDPVRKCWVLATPEELVRQRWLKHMIENLKFPREYLGVELELKSLPHLKDQLHLPRRRTDVICFAKGIHSYYPLFPLLLMECKAASFGMDAILQVQGYNEHVKAPFVAVVSKDQLIVRSKQGDLFELPSYDVLLKAVL